MSQLTLEKLAQDVGITSFPDKCNEFFDEVMADFDKNGCPYTNPAYYDMLHQKYGVLQTYLDLYKNAAIEIGKNESLSRTLTLLCRCLKDDDFRNGKYGFFSLPKDEGNFAYEMFAALAVASEVEISYNLLKHRNLPEDIFLETLRQPEHGISYFMMRHNNRPGFNLLEWFQLAINGKLFRLGRLEYEIFCGFKGKSYIFRNKEGKEIALAHNLPLHKSGMALGSKNYEDENDSWVANVEETPTCWNGYPVNENGFARNEIVSLPKNEWEIVLSPDDPVISVHIPAAGSLDAHEIDASLKKATNFFREHFPDYEYKAFVCYSWLMDPQLLDLLGPEKNISKFNKRFKKITRKSAGDSVFNFVFLKPDMNFALDELPENTSLERILKNHYQEGNAIYDTTGYFFQD